jgi:DNA-binding LacI/PurR family transcriptional regulator
MASVRLIAKRAGVSITTVSRVLNNHPQVSPEVRQRVLAASNEAGYAPTVGRKSTTNIAFVYTGESSLGSPFDAALLAGMSQGMEEQAFDLMILDARRARQANETFTQMFIRKGIRGAILRTTAQTRGVCESIAEEGFPVVVVADRFDNPKVNYVYGDSRESSRDAVEHLIGLGHRKIAICLNVVDDSDHVDRLAGYRQALSDHNIEFDNYLVLRVPAYREGGAQALRRLMTLPDRPTAAFLTDPLTAVGALSEARKTGINIPGDLSIVGFDDTEVRYGIYPTLTAVCQDAEALGREAFAVLKKLLAREEGADAARPAVIQKSLRTWLEVHESTAAPAVALNSTSS